MPDRNDHTPPDDSTATAFPPDRDLGRIGPYKILETIGEGGMGVVYLAEQEAPLRRRVALKVIKPGMDSKQVLARFEAERHALALMDHPCVAKVFDAGSTPEGRPYFVMEYVAGVPITDHCERHRLTLRERLELFTTVCDGVQHAHQKAIIHRDLKPSNVLVSLENGKAAPKIIDFGVAKATAQPLTDKSLFTELGVLIGTPEYMSPEQADLTGQNVDVRTDVYALGVMLYELLVGALPFEPKELRSAGIEGIRRMIRDVEPPKPSTRMRTLGGERSTDAAKHRRVDVPTLRRQLTGELDWITMKALEKDRARRYGSPAELAADLGRYGRNEPVSAGPPSAAYRARKFVRRHRVGVAFAVSGAVALIGFAAAMAVQTARIAREAKAKGEVSQFLVDLFKVSDPSEALGNATTARELLDRGAAKIRLMLKDEPEVRTELMATMGKVYRNLGLYERAESLQKEALEARRLILGANDPNTLIAMNDLGNTYTDEGRYVEAQTLLGETIAVQKRVLGPDHPDTLASLNNLGTLYWRQRRYAEAEAIHRETFETRKRVLGPDHPDTLTSMNNLSVQYTYLGRQAECETLDREVFEIRKRVLGPDHPDTLISMLNLAEDYSIGGRHTEAEALHRETVETRKRVLGPDHPDTLISMRALARTYQNEGRHAEANALLRETLAIQRRVLGPEHPDTLDTMDVLATDCSQQGRHSEAEALTRETLDITKRVRGPENSDTLRRMGMLAMEYYAQKRYEEFEALTREALEIQVRVLGPDHADTLNSMYNLGCVAALRGRGKEALGYLRNAVEHGYSLVDTIMHDSDLAALRRDPEFEKIVVAAKKNLERPAAAK